MKSKNIKAIVCIVALIAIISVCGIFAYLTDVDTASNKFTIGQVKIKLKEPKWEALTDENENDIPDFAEHMVPNATIDKDPQIENIGENSAYVYLKVTVPVENLITADENGIRKNNGEKAETQLFSYTTNEDWKEITSARESAQSEEGVTTSNTYVYYYNDVLEKGQTTTTLFDKVTFANVIEEEIDLNSYQIDIEAYAIQSNNLPEDTSIEAAYAIYLNQNK